MPTDDDWMAVALAEADRALEHEDVPIGCVVVANDGNELARAHNRREVDADPTAHAEMRALAAAATKVGHWRLDMATLYVTLEPCPMCAGALVNSRIQRVVFGALDPKAGALQSLFTLGSDSRLNHRFEVTGGVRSEECAQRLRSFFAMLRARGEK